MSKEELKNRLESAVYGVWGEYKTALGIENGDVHFSIAFETEDFCDQIADMIILNENLMNM